MSERNETLDQLMRHMAWEAMWHMSWSSVSFQIGRAHV